MEAQKKRERERQFRFWRPRNEGSLRVNSSFHFLNRSDGFSEGSPFKKTKQTEALNIGEGTAKEGGTC